MTELLHEDYAPPPPSPRHVEAVHLGKQLLGYGVEVTEPARHRRRCWRMTCRAESPAGHQAFFGVEVYSTEYFRVYFADGESEAVEVFASTAEALAYCWARWVRWDDAVAATIPRWRPKRKPKGDKGEAGRRPAPNHLEGVEFPADFFGGGNG